ncbi:metal-dependent hydrolase [Rhodohalobacter sp. 8-1]|uniref:metal-dependent hydrolase n=1 Tax=Rhodohalobacter sp. 8-1 TaxID=3131972 RepID=UPI0030EEF1FF
MDPLTHGLTGTMAAMAFTDENDRNRPAIIGAAAAMLPDIEAFIQAPGDPLFNLEIHRQFTHSLIFIPVGALVAATLFWLIFRKQVSFSYIYLFSIAGYSTHWFMDLITSYGTELLWPFVDTRFALNIVSVVDPIITGGMLIFTSLALFKSHTRFLAAAWLWLSLFLLLGWMQNNRASSAMQQLASGQHHIIESGVVKPTIGNQLVWRATYISRDSVYTDAIRTGLFSGIQIYEGESEPLISVEEDFEAIEGTTLYRDLKRFSRLSDGFLVRHPNRPEIIGDAAYSMLPTSLIPLWGVEADTSNPGSHVTFHYFRDASDDIREPFIDMLLGRKIGDD